jgi:hypothetical protein
MSVEKLNVSKHPQLAFPGIVTVPVMFQIDESAFTTEANNRTASTAIASFIVVSPLRESYSL